MHLRFWAVLFRFATCFQSWWVFLLLHCPPTTQRIAPLLGGNESLPSTQQGPAALLTPEVIESCQIVPPFLMYHGEEFLYQGSQRNLLVLS